MEESKKKKERSTKDLLQYLLECGKEMDEGVDDHQGIIIGDRLEKLPASKENE